jgi:serine protease Do
MNSSRIMKLLAIVMLLVIASAVIADARNPFVEVVKAIRPSVVNIKVQYEAPGASIGNLPFDDDFFKFFFPQPQPELRTRKVQSMGTGFIFKRDGNQVFIITNNHVVEKGREKSAKITVTLEDKEEFIGEVVGLDSDTDLAVIKIEIDRNQWVTIAPLGESSTLEVGQWAIAIGNPFGAELNRTVTVGVISAVGRSNFNFGRSGPLYQDYIQTDAAINRGNSGGPLVDIDGNVIGVNAAISTPNQGNVGIGFAIPADMVKIVMNDLMDYGEVVRGYLGILPQEITSDLRKSLNLEDFSGVLIAKVEDDTPAAKAGLKKGDVIIRFNNQEIPNVSKFRIVVAESEIDKKLPVEIVRDKKTKKLNVTLIKRPDQLAQVDEKSAEADWLGIKVESLDSEFARKFKFEDEDSGVVISSIEKDSPAEASELQIGDLILEINNVEISDVAAFSQVRDELQNSKSDLILFYVKSANGTYHYVAVNLNK